MRKGFTIVELAIVLVVIGIILGMAVKGRALVEAAQVKAEIARLYKLEAAANIYYSTTGGNIPVGGYNGGVMNVDPYLFIDKGLVTMGDFRINSKFYTGTTLGIYALLWCEPRNDDGTDSYFGVAYEPVGLCAMAYDGAGEGHFYIGLNTRLVCHMEHALDDDSPKYGQLRNYNGEQAEIEKFDKNCDIYPLSSAPRDTARTVAYKLI